MAIPKGKLLIIGGHEDKKFEGATPDSLHHEMHSAHFEILGRLITSAPRAHHIIEIIATASSIPEEMESLYVSAYKEAGFTHVGIIHIENTEQAADEAFIKRIQFSHAIFFTGGDQVRLTSTLRESPVLEAIKRKYHADPNFVVAGTSAGAMSIPQKMISRGIIEEMLLKEDLTTGTGLGFLDGIIVDTHFIKRGRFGRLAHAVALYAPECTGIGLGEDGALLITDGNAAECLGTGMVIIIDGSSIGATNVAYAADATPLAIEGLKVHIMAEGCRYLIAEKKFSISTNQTVERAGTAW